MVKKNLPEPPRLPSVPRISEKPPPPDGPGKNHRKCLSFIQINGKIIAVILEPPRLPERALMMSP